MNYLKMLIVVSLFCFSECAVKRVYYNEKISIFLYRSGKYYVTFSEPYVFKLCQSSIGRYVLNNDTLELNSLKPIFKLQQDTVENKRSNFIALRDLSDSPNPNLIVRKTTQLILNNDTLVYNIDEGGFVYTELLESNLLALINIPMGYYNSELVVPKNRLERFGLKFNSNFDVNKSTVEFESIKFVKKDKNLIYISGEIYALWYSDTISVFSNQFFLVTKNKMIRNFPRYLPLK